MIIRSFLTCTFLCAIFLTEAQTEEADSLYRLGRYFDASIAYERVLFEKSGSPSLELRRPGETEAAGSEDRAKGPTGELFTAIIGKVRCLKRQQLFDQAVTFLNGWQSYPFSNSGRRELQSQQILCTYLGGHFENTLSLVDRWPYLHAGSPPAPALVVLKILSLNELQRWAEAGAAYRTFIAQQPAMVAVPDLYEHLPHLKSVNKARWLSYFIPGGGQFYAGKPGEALLSVLIQSAGIYFAVLSWEQHYYISAWLVGAALFGSFHMGGVRRSEGLVQEYNRKKILLFNEQVRAQLMGLLQ